MSNMNNPMSRATKAEIKAARRLPVTTEVPATTEIVVKATKAPKEKAVDDPTKLTIAALSRELEKDPKTVRARLRRLYDQDTEKKLPQPIDNAAQRWTFNIADRDALVSLITVE